MTPKEKAEELYTKYGDNLHVHILAKQCALIAVDEMIKINGDAYLNGVNEVYYRKTNGYLFEVKQEIEKL